MISVVLHSNISKKINYTRVCSTFRIWLQHLQNNFATHIVWAMFRWTLGSESSDYEEYHLLGCNTMPFNRSPLTFWVWLLPAGLLFGLLLNPKYCDVCCRSTVNSGNACWQPLLRKQHVTCFLCGLTPACYATMGRLLFSTRSVPRQQQPMQQWVFSLWSVHGLYSRAVTGTVRVTSEYSGRAAVFRAELQANGSGDIGREATSEDTVWRLGKCYSEL
jgi:hypothetical protein